MLVEMLAGSLDAACRIFPAAESFGCRLRSGMRLNAVFELLYAIALRSMPRKLPDGRKGRASKIVPDFSTTRT